MPVELRRTRVRLGPGTLLQVPGPRAVRPGAHSVRAKKVQDGTVPPCGVGTENRPIAAAVDTALAAIWPPQAPHSCIRGYRTSSYDKAVRAAP
jgi:hypothetical protein